MEICAALSALGGIAAFINLLREVKKRKSIKRINRRIEKRVETYPVNVGGRIQLKHEIYEEVVEEEYNEKRLDITKGYILKLVEYLDAELIYIEIYNKNGELIRIWWQKDDKEE